MSDHSPHFSARDFIEYVCRTRDTRPEDFGIRPDVVVSYVGGLPTQVVRWGLARPAARLFHVAAWNSSEVTLLQGPVGAPQAAAVMEELNALGAKRVWVLGYAGSLKADYALGTVTGVSQAFSDEGTSRHYERTGWGIGNAALMERIRRVNPELPWVRGWTTDAIYRETPAKIRYFAELGCQVVDMEASCLFHVGHVLGLEVTAIMVISDELYHAWRPGFGLPEVEAGIHRAYGILTDVIGISGSRWDEPGHELSTSF
ncbi:MAG: hypothetical protein M0Z53_05565 [Thermaerobacter sp.]|nr:hypothetical protein [Thermaerobacter sp.]